MWTDDALALLRLTPGSSRARHTLDALAAASVVFAPLTAGYVRYLAHEDASARELYRTAHAAPSATALERAVASFYLAAIAERAGDVAGALDLYARSIAEEPAGYLADDARWWRALLLEEGEPAAAAGGRERAATASRWHALLRAETGAIAAPLPPAASYDPTALASLLEAAAAGSGESATLRLPSAAAGEWAPSRGGEAAALEWIDARFGARPAGLPSALDDGALRVALLLAEVGEPSVARALLREVTARYRDRPHELYAIASIASAAGLVDSALWAAETLLRPLDAAARAELPPALAALAYPAPFGSEVLDAAVAEGVPPLLLLALMRQESAFNPQAGSSAQAYGLTQVIGPTGRQIAPRWACRGSPRCSSSPRARCASARTTSRRSSTPSTATCWRRSPPTTAGRRTRDAGERSSAVRGPTATSRPSTSRRRGSTWSACSRTTRGTATTTAPPRSPPCAEGEAERAGGRAFVAAAARPPLYSERLARGSRGLRAAHHASGETAVTRRTGARPAGGGARGCRSGRGSRSASRAGGSTASARGWPRAAGAM